ncbi:monofunctional biosynthetic peptidoglycan transglycosylase [Sphingomonas kyeonggiensis]|uniref:Biosynthetic peptidoglycan transglycosylase n=2 Tax=Sphingomonadaceae TaxID=41297 RepID=A0A7W7NT01_9SPHN|nr:monofunctional biosynthetic peptidoglycan transglycosylase [Sphingomonas kyeonggiensis]
MGDQDRDTGAEAPRQPEASADIPPAPSASAPRPRDWTPRATTAGQPEELGVSPMPDLRPLGEEPDPFASRREEAPRPIPAQEEIKPQRPRKPLLRRILFWILKAILLFIAVSVGMVVIYKFVPPPITWTQIGDIFSGHGVTKRWMSIDRIDPNMPRAAIAAEDARFCSHHGFDFTAIEQAYARNATGKKKIRGGSTISQQTAKNVFLFQGGGYARKALEAYFTVLIENIWGKRRIMEVYLNVAETGIGTYGVNAGALRYFKHDASNLSPREAAQVAAVLPLPKKRAGIDPRGFTRRYGNAITARIGTVRGDGLDSCIR